MVLDCCITISSTIISLMMNGICCVYQQSEEQKLREAIRQDVRSEYCYAMYHHAPPHPDVVIPTPIPAAAITTNTASTADIVMNHSMDDEESVFIVSSMHIQEGRQIKLIQKDQRHVGITRSVTSFRHDNTASPFIQYTKNHLNSMNNTRNSNEMNDDEDEEIQRIISSSTSWTTISIV
jgi:hypothetical protein